MIYEVITTVQADDDLRCIYEYIAFELLSPDNAAWQLGRLEKHIVGLEEFPEKFRLYEKEPWHSRGLRFFPVDNYLVFYKTDDETEIVYVVRIMYGGRDVHKQLSQTEDVSVN